MLLQNYFRYVGDILLGRDTILMLGQLDMMQ